jgi:mono/diheme cytochrome c family protein
VTFLKSAVASIEQRLPQNRSTRITWSAALLVSVALVLLPFALKLDGSPHADWLQFLGRFHPLAVHIPIGLIVLIPVLEFAGEFRPALREAAGFVLALAFIGCLVALTLGYLLAYGGGSAGALVTRHMWGGIALTLSVLVCLLVRPTWTSGSLQRLYPATLTCTLLLLAWTAHQGGSLTHGRNYLTDYMPPVLKRMLALGVVQAKAPASNSFYAKHIDPIFDAKCVACHGASKTQGGLRLDSYALLMEGGRDGAVILPGNPARSLLLVRVTLPPSHKKFMPAEGKPPLTQEQIAWIRAWIQQGASPTATHLNGIEIQDASEDEPLQSVGDYSALMPAILALENSQGAKLLPVSSKPSDGLVLNTVDVAANFGDAQLAEFEKYAPYIVEAELGRTAVTDASLTTLATFTHLRALHLEDTRVAGAGLQKLTALSQLRYLNLSGTKVTQAELIPLRSMKNLRHLYLYNTPAQPASLADAAQPAGRSAQ